MNIGNATTTSLKPGMEVPPRSQRYSTADIPMNERQEWLREVIGREYANVEITPPTHDDLFNEMIIYPWNDLRLSSIRSNEITLQRLPREPDQISQDAYFAVIHLSGHYSLQQNGREVMLQPGDISLYDATLPHRIRCSRKFSKLIVSIPRPLLKERIAGVEHCTALRISGHSGVGAVASNFIRSALAQSGQLSTSEFSALSEHSLDLLTLALASVRPSGFNLSRSRSIMLSKIKRFVTQHLGDPELNADRVAIAVGLSPRYINTLFNGEDTSLMRYVLQCRLENCRKDLLNPLYADRRISDIAFRWGFNDSSHFSRVFKQRYGCSASEYRLTHMRK